MQIESVFDKIDNVLQTTELEALYQDLEELVGEKDLKFMMYNEEDNAIHFPQLGAVMPGQHTMQIYHVIQMQSDGEILIRRGYREGIGMASMDDKISTYTLLNVKNVADAVGRVKAFVLKYHKAYKVLTSVEKEMHNASEAVLQLPAENTEHRSGL